METLTPSRAAQKYNTANSIPTLTAIRDYYTNAGPDYETWSRNFNMHFGYYRKFSNIFSLEKMLVNMNDEVMRSLQLPPGKDSHIADLGCGMATVARYIASRNPLTQIQAFTIVDYQIDTGERLNKKAGLDDRVTMIKGNFEDLPVAANAFTHVYALESACHSNGSAKEPFIEEMVRVLKQGGRFCIADGFLKNNHKKPRFFSWLYKRIAGYWAVPGFACIHDFEDKLREQGLTDIKVREISYRIAPSVLYVPLICIKFFFKEIWKNRSLRMKKERWHNVYAPLLGMIMGLYRRHFGYYIISGEKG